MAKAHNARNAIPDFLKPDGPVLAVRLKNKVGSTEAGEVLPLFTVNGRTDAYACAVEPRRISQRYRESGAFGFRRLCVRGRL